MNRRELLLAMVRAGMIQFGYFAPTDGAPSAPIRFQLTLLPSFPTLMAALANEIAAHLGPLPADTRLLAVTNMISVASIVALKTNIPLLYPLPTETSWRIEGAADVRNPIVLVADVLRGDAADQSLWKEASRIGLPVTRAISVFDVMPTAQDFPHRGLYQAAELIEWLYAEKRITSPLAEHLNEWFGL